MVVVRQNQKTITLETLPINWWGFFIQNFLLR